MFFRIQFCFCNWKAMNCYVFFFLWIKFATVRFHFFSERRSAKTSYQNTRSLQSFTWVSWGYLPSTDISCRPHFRRFLPSFLCCYLFSKCNIHFFILVFSDPILFSLSFPVFYFPCLLLSTFLLCLSLHILYFLFLSFLSAFYFLSCYLLSFSSNFLCLPSSFSFCFYLFLCLLLYVSISLGSSFALKRTGS